jgi:hypothetical protein
MTVDRYSFYVGDGGNRITAKWCTRSAAETYGAELADDMGCPIEVWCDDPEHGLDDELIAVYDPD